jgi:hypothetical protein
VLIVKRIQAKNGKRSQKDTRRKRSLAITDAGNSERTSELFLKWGVTVVQTVGELDIDLDNTGYA